MLTSSKDEEVVSEEEKFEFASENGGNEGEGECEREV